MLISIETYAPQFIGHNKLFLASVDPEGGAQPEGGSDSKELHEIYEGCYKSKGCFGVPSDCVEKGTCNMMASYAYSSTDKQFKFDLHLKNVDANKYVALGKFAF